MELSAQSRQTTGTKVKRLRLQGITPGVVFSKKSSIGKADVLNIQVNSKELVKLYKSAGESTLIDLNVDGVKKDVLIKNIQINPLNYKPVHISLSLIHICMMFKKDSFTIANYYSNSTWAWITSCATICI